MIGHIGTTGRAHGAHVHFEVRIDGHPVDPRPFLALAACTARRVNRSRRPTRPSHGETGRAPFRQRPLPNPVATGEGAPCAGRGYGNSVAAGIACIVAGAGAARGPAQTTDSQAVGTARVPFGMRRVAGAAAPGAGPVRLSRHGAARRAGRRPLPRRCRPAAATAAAGSCPVARAASAWRRASPVSPASSAARASSSRLSACSGLASVSLRAACMRASGSLTGASANAASSGCGAMLQLWRIAASARLSRPASRSRRA